MAIGGAQETGCYKVAWCPVQVPPCGDTKSGLRLAAPVLGGASKLHRHIPLGMAKLFGQRFFLSLSDCAFGATIASGGGASSRTSLPETSRGLILSDPDPGQKRN